MKSTSYTYLTSFNRLLISISCIFVLEIKHKEMNQSNIIDKLEKLDILYQEIIDELEIILPLCPINIKRQLEIFKIDIERERKNYSGRTSERKQDTINLINYAFTQIK